MSPVWDELFEKWVIPFSCPCCTKCWLQTDKGGTPVVSVDKFGNVRMHCVYGGPYKGYVEAS